MAENYNKTTQGGAATNMSKILEQQEAFWWPLNDTTWTRLRVGMLASFTSTGTNDVMSSPTHDKNATGNPFVDQYWFGLATRGSGDADMVGTNGALFAGYAPTTGNSVGINFALTQVRLGFSFNNRLDFVTVNPSGTKADGGNTGILTYMGESAKQDDSTDFAGLLSFDVEIQNDGTGTMELDFNKQLTDVAHDRGDERYLLNELQTGTYATLPTTMAWNTASTTPWTKPTHIFVFFPWSDVRCRIHSIGAYKLA